MKKIEFHTTPAGDVEVISQGQAPYILSESHRDLILKLTERIRNDYSEAYEALADFYKSSLANKKYYEFLIVRRFIRCNWAQYDNVLDIDADGRMNFEYVSCPMRGECIHFNIVCNPTKNTNISPAEMNVFRLIVTGLEAKEIAEKLFSSIHTVNNHRNSILKKLSLHNTASLVAYWHENKLK